MGLGLGLGLGVGLGLWLGLGLGLGLARHVSEEQVRQDVARERWLDAVDAAQRTPHRHAPRLDPQQRCSLGAATTAAVAVSAAILTIAVTVIVAVLEVVEFCRRVAKLHGSCYDSCRLLRLG